MQSLLADVLAAWRASERALQRLEPYSPAWQREADIAVELRALYQELTAGAASVDEGRTRLVRLNVSREAAGA